MWGREAADFKEYSCARKGVERVWLPSASSGGAAATLQAVFVDAGYQSPYEVHRGRKAEWMPGPELAHRRHRFVPRAQRAGKFDFT